MLATTLATIRNIMKKILLILTGLMLLIITSFITNSAYAVSPSNVIVEACKDKLPQYPTEAEKIDLNEPYNGKYNLNFRIAFETARTEYHAYVKCIFDKATKDILGSEAEKLLQPDTACLKEEKLVEILNDGSPANLLKPILEIYNKYVDYLNLLSKKASENLEIEAGGSNIAKIFTEYGNLQLIVENEVQNAIVALDSAFIALKEMRQAFVMHVHFQCMMKNLELYRQALGNIRRVVSAIPPLIEDASMHR